MPRTSFPDPSLTSLALNRAVARLRADPLVTFRATSEAQRQLIHWVSQGVETYWRSGNSGGKTCAGAALGIALARGVTELDGVALPKLPVPNVGWVLTQSYKQQLDASQKSYLQWLGDWPHDLSYVAGKSKGYIESLYLATTLCRHRSGASCETCSRITFHCEESESAIGGRIDWAHADEPPKESVWREVRARRRPGQPFPRFITATPLERRRWEWLKDDFQRCLVYASAAITRGSERRSAAREGRGEIRSTIFDNAALSAEDVAAFLRDFQGDPYLEARIRGDYKDISGACPFNAEKLNLWLGRCHDPLRVETINVLSELDQPTGRIITEVKVPVHVWFDPEEDERYFAVWDPSSGVKSKKHDPAGGVIVARRRPRVVVTVNAFLAPYGLGSLAAILGRRYHDALTDVDMTGGYGGPFLTALSTAGYHKINRDTDPDRPGQWSQRLGFRITSANRAELVGSIQQAILEDAIECYSEELVSCLLNIVLTRSDSGHERYQAAYGRHDEFFICLGRALYLLYSRPLAVRRDTISERLHRRLGLPRRRVAREPRLRFSPG